MPNLSGHIGIKIVDDSGEVTSVPLYVTVADTVTLATMHTAITTAVDLVGSLTLGEVIKAYVVWETPGFTASAPVENCRIESTGLFKAVSQNGLTRSYGIDIPAFNFAKLITGQKNINMADLDVVDFVSWLTTPATFTPVTPSGNPFDEVPSGRQTFRKHRRLANRH